MSSSVAAVQASCVALCGGKPKTTLEASSSGVIREEEEDDVLTPLPDAAAKPNSVKRVQTLSGGADLSTIPDDLQEALAEFDIDGGGVLRVDDIVEAAKLYRDSQDVRKRLYKFLLGLGIFVFVLLGAITGLTAAMVELSKDTKPDSSGIMVLKGTNELAKVDNPGLSVGNTSQQVSERTRPPATENERWIDRHATPFFCFGSTLPPAMTALPCFAFLAISPSCCFTVCFVSRAWLRS